MESKGLPGHFLRSANSNAMTSFLPVVEYPDSRLAVIADDLTGACDTACQFALYGFRPEVMQLATCGTRQPQFLVCNSESRKDEANAARQKVFSLALKLLNARYLPFYKKLDSTLKGPWIAELDGMARATKPEIVIVAPAFPAWGRTTVDGIQRVHGRPGLESRFHALPHGDLSGSAEPGDLVQALRAQFGNRVRHIRCTTLKRGAAATAREMEAAQFHGFPFLVCDAETEEDVKTIALASCRLDRRILWAGSGGLARYLPLGWGLRIQAPSGPRRACVQSLVINGSFNPANKDQLACLEQGGTTVCWLEDQDAEDRALCQRKLRNLVALLEQGQDVALSVRLAKPIKSTDQLQRLQDALQLVATGCLAAVKNIGLVLIGGDTSIKLFRSLEATAIRVEGEVQPGVPYGQWVGGHLSNQPLVTKAGGFGRTETLAKAIAFLKGE